MDLLREVLQLNQPDLDFGLYRIMNARAEEIETFLSEDLLRIVDEAFAGTAEDRAREAKAAYDEVLSQAKAFGIEKPEESPKVKDAKETYEAALAAGSDEADVYDHLRRFFERYYDAGDFLSRRYYTAESSDRAAAYAVPYDGSEVYFHWANKDQYYVKTTENFRAFTFDAASAVDDEQQRLFADEDDPLRVHLRVVDAAEGEHNNVKADEGKDRFYVIDDTPIEWEGDELVIRFQYRHDPEKGRSHANTWRERRNGEAVEAVLDVLGSDEHSHAAEYRRVLTRAVPRGKKGQQPLLLRYVTRFTARNTMDYFIHKDLGSFLQRELDFYIKNEVVRLDDLEAADAPRVEGYLAKVRVLRKIARAIIDFLAQTEDFQKQLWLKKKFVVETQYCLTLDRVPEAFYAEIIANDAQREEWVRLFAIDEIEEAEDQLGYAVPLTVDFLKANPFLVLDTALFDEDFKARLLDDIENLDEQCDGVLMHSENFQALQLMKAKFRNTAKCVYIDPPYNSKTSEIPYKNSYKHSSWLSLMQDRLRLGKSMLQDVGVNVVAIDENEQEALGHLLNSIFPGYDQTCVTIVSNPSGQQGDNFSYSHDFAYFNYPKGGQFIGYEIREENADVRNFRDVTGDSSLRNAGANCFYPILIKDGEVIGFGDVCDESYHPASINIEREDGLVEVYPIDPQNIERKWRFARQTVESIQSELDAHYIKKRGVWDIKRTKDKFNFKTVWTDSKYSANNHGTQLLNNILGPNPFEYPKSIYNVMDCIVAAENESSHGFVLDFFGGSGTTGHAVISLNREDEGSREYLLVDVEDYFDDVIKTRTQKVIYSKEWKDGKPVGREGVSHCFKYLRLESYEDTLNNLVLADDEAAKQRQRALAESEGLRHDYWLRYWLDLETRGSASLLSAEHFTEPDGYWLTVKRPSSDEQTLQRVDLVETFNWLLGLHVTRLRAPETFTPDFERPSDPELPGEDNTRLAVKGTLEPADEGEFRLRAVEGWVAKTPGSDVERQNVLVVWRTLTGDVEQDDAVLEAYLRERFALDFDDVEGTPPYEVIYVNGSPTLPKRQGLEVRPLEPEFHRRMWDTNEV